MNNIFSEKIRELRKEKGLTQKELALVLDISCSCYAGYEQGYREPDLKILEKIADFFQCSIDYLLGREDDLGVISIKSPVGEYSPQEQELLTLYRSLNESARAQVLGYTRFLCASQQNNKKR